MARCSGLKPDGSGCERIVGPYQEFCYAHDPRHREERRTQASRAGRGNSYKELREIRRALARLYEDVREGAVDKSVGTALATIANIRLRALSLEKELREVQELEGAVQELESAMYARIGSR